MVRSIREKVLLHLVDVYRLMFAAFIQYAEALEETLLVLSSDFKVVYLQLSCFIMLFYWPCLPCGGKYVYHFE